MGDNLLVYKQWQQIQLSVEGKIRKLLDGALSSGKISYADLEEVTGIRQLEMMSMRRGFLGSTTMNYFIVALALGHDINITVG